MDRKGRIGRRLYRLASTLTVMFTAASLLALGGDRSATLDVLATFAPVMLAGLIACGVLALATSPRYRARGPGIVAAIGLAGIAISSCLIVPEYLRPIARAEPADGRPVLRVLTFNVWRQNRAPQQVIDTILAADADIVLLQEADGSVGDRLGWLRQRYPYQSRCSWRCGEVILSKRPFTNNRRFRVNKTTPILVYGQTTAPDGGPLTLVTLHYTWPLPSLRQDLQQRQLIEGMRFVDTDTLVLTGDMNLTPWSFAMARQDRALAPLVRQTRGMFSWPSYRSGGWRTLMPPLLPIDQIYTGRAWVRVRIERLAASSSDHYPVLVTLVRR